MAPSWSAPLAALLAANAAAVAAGLRGAHEDAALQPPRATLAAGPKAEIDLVNFSLLKSGGEALAGNQWSPLASALLPDGKEVACLNCDANLFEAWVDEISNGPLAQKPENDGELYSGGKHPNAPGYDEWQAKNAGAQQEKKSALLQRLRNANATNSTDAHQRHQINVSVRNLGPSEMEAERPRLQQLWAERRLVLGWGAQDPVQRQMDFVQALVSLARGSPALVPEDCGRHKHEAPVCGALLSDMQPVAKEGELHDSLADLFGERFLRENRHDPKLAPKEQRRRVTNLLQKLKADYHFYRQGCLADDIDGHAKSDEKCSAAPTQMVGRIACAPEMDRLQDDCVYAELRRCSSGCSSKRFFEYARFHGPLALFSTKGNRGAVMGQCEEFSRAGYAMLASAGYEARYVLDFTDHVWVEVKLPSETNATATWVHADPSEGVLDQPLMYEQGWGKQLTMIFAFTPWEVEHVTTRYTAKYQETVRRRGFPEANLNAVLAEANGRLAYELPLHSWGYNSGFTGSKGRSLEDVAMWSYFEGGQKR